MATSQLPAQQPVVPPVYLRPRTLDDALAALRGGGCDILAGGTDYYAARVGRPLDEPMLDISAVTGLRGIIHDAQQWCIGAATTWSDLHRAALPPLFAGLQTCALQVGGLQVQNRATLAGNLCNASPAADGVPALMALDARVRLASASATRSLPVDAFVLGPRRTARQADELVVAIDVPVRADSARARSVFLKHGHRSYLVISIAMLALTIETDADGVITYAGCAVGACGAKAVRLARVESLLLGRPCEARLAEQLDASHLDGISPIDDIRGTAAYRRDCALTLLRRAVRAVAAQPVGGGS